MSESRHQERYDEVLEVRVIWSGRETLVGKTRNFSDGGCCVEVRFEPQPPPGTEITLQLNAPVAGAEAPVLRALVRWNADDRIGCSFIFDA